MMLPNQTISRRTVLKGLGTAVALPLLEAMTPRLAVAGMATAKKELPLRMGVVYVPNGVNMAEWKPVAEGALKTLPSILEPLAPVKDQLLVLSGLTCDKARAHGDGPGDHARAMSAFLTGAQPRKTAGADIHAGRSFDQFLAQQIGKATPIPVAGTRLRGRPRSRQLRQRLFVRLQFDGVLADRIDAGPEGNQSRLRIRSPIRHRKDRRFIRRTSQAPRIPAKRARPGASTTPGNLKAVSARPTIASWTNT